MVKKGKGITAGTVILIVAVAAVAIGGSLYWTTQLQTGEDTEGEEPPLEECEGFVYHVRSKPEAERTEVGVRTKRFDSLASEILDDPEIVDNTEETLQNLSQENIESELFDELGRNIMIFWIQDETEVIDGSGREITIDEVEIGDKVRGLWKGPVMESFPPQVTVKKFILLEDE